MGLTSADWGEVLSHLNTLYEVHSFKIPGQCFGSLSDWNINLLKSPNYSTDSFKLFFKMFK